MNNIEELGKESIVKLLVKYSVPAVISLLVNSLYTVVDRIFLGNIPEIGALALTAVGLTIPITTVVLALSALISVGAGSNISIKLGEGKKIDAENVAGNSMTLSVIFGILITIIYLIFQNQILGWLGVHSQTLSYAKDYINIIMLGTVFSMLGFALPFIIRSDGSPKFSAAITLIGCIINIGLDALFILVFNMGIQGAAIATVLAQIATVVLGLSYYIKGKSNLRLTKANFKLHPVSVKPIFLIGLVSFANQISISIAQIISNYSLTLYGGELAIGAMTTINSIMAIFLMPVYGLLQGFQPIVGFNYAKNQHDRAIKTLLLAVACSATILAVGTLIIQLFPAFMVGLFNNDAVLVNTAVNGIKKYTLVFPIASIPIFGSGYMMLTGRPKAALLLLLSRQSLILAPTLFFLPKLIGLNGIWFAQPITDILTCLITIIVLVKGNKHISHKK